MFTPLLYFAYKPSVWQKSKGSDWDFDQRSVTTRLGEQMEETLTTPSRFFVELTEDQKQAVAGPAIQRQLDVRTSNNRTAPRQYGTGE